jgi:uncharacterized protein HemY
MEYIRTNNVKTASIALQDALNLCHKDPLIYNELGVVHFKQKLYDIARDYFMKGLEICKEDSSLVYQNLTINLAHTCRKQKYNFLIIILENLTMRFATMNKF